jgi:N-acetylglucosamine kinase-like BadF-type ATPase
VSFFLGIDAGGTKTECALADASGTLLARGIGGPANLRRTPPAIIEESLGMALTHALRTAGLHGAEFEAVCGGFAGASRPDARELARHILFALTSSRHLFIVGDMEVALEAAVGAGSGVVLIAGTGSVAYGRNDFGQQARAGGKGPWGSDEGSAVDIGRRALEAVLRAREGRERTTALEPALRGRFDVTRREERAQLLASPEAIARVAALMPEVVEVARQGDDVAREVLLAAGDALAQLALTVMQALRLENTAARVAISGGVFAVSTEVAEEVRRRLREWAPHAQVEPLGMTPAEGAVRLAQRLWLQRRVGLPVVSR